METQSVPYSSAVALAFEEMRTPYTSGEKFAYKNSEMRTKEKPIMPHFKSTIQIQRNKCYSQTMRTFFSQPYSRMFRDRLRHVLFGTS